MKEDIRWLSTRLLDIYSHFNDADIFFKGQQQDTLDVEKIKKIKAKYKNKNESIMKKINYFKAYYDCEDENNCKACCWFNGEQCIRQLLTDEDINEIETKYFKK